MNAAGAALAQGTADRAGVCRSTNTGFSGGSVMHIAFRNTAIGYLYTFACKKLTLRRQFSRSHFCIVAKR